MADAAASAASEHADAPPADAPESPDEHSGEEEDESDDEGDGEGEVEEEEEGAAAQAAGLESPDDLLDPLWLVRDSAAFIAAHARHARMDAAAVRAVAAQWSESGLASCTPVFDRCLHFVDESRPALTAQYLFVLDALNFCFWPDADVAPRPEDAFEYAHLAGGLKAAVEADPSCLDAAALLALDGLALRALLRWPRPLPCEEERARALRQTAAALAAHFEGSAASLVARARGSASTLVALVAAHFPAFRDAAVYHGRQVFFYKRAQIFVGDLYGAFGGDGLGAFADIGSLTMFADYRVPVVLRQLGMLRYSAELAAAVEARTLLAPGCEEEVEIRGASIAAVEALKAALGSAAARQGAAGPSALALDWHLWEAGEAARLTSPPHHRTLSVFY